MADVFGHHVYCNVSFLFLLYCGDSPSLERIKRGKSVFRIICHQIPNSDLLPPNAVSVSDKFAASSSICPRKGMKFFIKSGLDPLSPSGVQLTCNKTPWSVKPHSVCAVLRLYIYSIHILVSSYTFRAKHLVKAVLYILLEKWGLILHSITKERYYT